MSITINGFNCIKFEDGKGTTYNLNFFRGMVKGSEPRGTETELIWSGHSFEYHVQDEDAELRVSGTLSEDCWTIKTLHATFHQDDYYTSELTITDLPLPSYIFALCPGEIPETDFSYICLEPEQYVTSMKARIKRQTGEWVSFSSVDWPNVYGLKVRFRKDL
jgi:hypothetical protein